MASSTIRFAEPEDAGALASLSGELGYPVTVDEIERRLVAFADRDQEAVFVAESGNDRQVVGWLHVSIRRTLETGCRAEIVGLVVTQAARGGGVGSLLLEHAEQWITTHGIDEMLVRSQSKRTGAHNFYRRRGYRDLKIQNVFIKNLKPTPE